MFIDIVGAGLAGLLAGRMLSHHACEIFETQKELPNNHSAVLRFRTSVVGDVLGIPFKKVSLIKTVVPWKNPVADALAYSRKNGQIMRSDRSIINGELVDERYIAPDDLIARMATGLKIKYGETFQFIHGEHPIISTIPMPVLMKALNYPSIPKFRYTEGKSITATISNCDAYVGLSVPAPSFPFSRISITGNHMIIEIPGSHDFTQVQIIGQACELLGLAWDQITNVTSREQKYAKINPIDDTARKDFIHWATMKHNVYSLGRFATWRPGLLLDDLVQDIRLIDRLVTRQDRYAVALAD